MTDPEILAAVVAAAGREPREPLVLALKSPEPVQAPAGWTSDRLDRKLLEAESRGLLRKSDRVTGDGSVAQWFVLEPTINGLRATGEWPPAGREHLPGPWDSKRWGTTALPRLKALLEIGPAHDFLYLHHADVPGDAADNAWRSTFELLESELISGEVQSGGISDLIVTADGVRAAEGKADDPLDRAMADLHRGAKAEAMTAAVEEALAKALRRLADEHEIPTNNEHSSRPVPIAQLNEQLRKRTAYDAGWAADIAAWLALRNETNHGRGAAISHSRISRAIDGISEFRETAALPDCP